MKKISVCIPTFNGSLYISEQLQSILSQLSVDDEVIVSDDSSTDDTILKIEQITDPRVTVLKNNKYKSPIYNLENAINHSNGNVIILADQDDVWLPGRVNEIITVLESADLVLTNAYIVNDSLTNREKTLFETLGTQKGIFKNLMKNSYVGCCMAFNKVLKAKILPFPPNLPMHDQWIGLVAEIFYSVKLIENPSILYRRHDSNSSNTGMVSKNGILKKLQYRFNMIMALIFYAVWR